MGAWQVTKKDLRLLLRDRRAAAVLIAFPLAFICILGMSTGRLLGWHAENELLKIAVVNQDGGIIADRLVDSLAKLDGLRIVSAADRRSAQTLIESRKSNVTVVIGEAFGRQVQELRREEAILLNPHILERGLDRVDIDVSGESPRSKTALVVGHLVRAAVLQVTMPELTRTDRDALPVDQSTVINSSTKRVGKSAQQRESNQPSSINGAARNPVVYQQLVPAYTVMFAFFLVTVMARSFISERELGTLRRLRIAPVSAPGLLAGKTIPFLILSLFQSVALFCLGRVLFGMSWGPYPWLLIPVIICTSMAATALGLLIATVVRTDSQVSAYANFLVIMMAGISGCFLPRAWLPPLMQKVSLSTPHAWSLIAFDQILSNTTPSISVVIQCCVMLLAFAVALFIAGCWRFRAMD